MAAVSEKRSMFLLTSSDWFTSLFAYFLIGQIGLTKTH